VIYITEDDWSPIFTAMVEKKYRVVIPSVIRKALGISEGDLVEVKIRKVGRKWRMLRE
jgi:looped-hinge helix DNA binding domain, AbrB family